MPSRKRNEGKERKLKKEATANQTCLWRRWASGNNEASCSHGCVALPPTDHPVSRFMNAFEEARFPQGYGITTFIDDTFQRHSEVWSNVEHDKLQLICC